MANSSASQNTEEFPICAEYSEVAQHCDCFSDRYATGLTVFMAIRITQKYLLDTRMESVGSEFFVDRDVGLSVSKIQNGQEIREEEITIDRRKADL
jgi:hypothetical protein